MPSLQNKMLDALRPLALPCFAIANTEDADCSPDLVQVAQSISKLFERDPSVISAIKDAIASVQT